MMEQMAPPAASTSLAATMNSGAAHADYCSSTPSLTSSKFPLTHYRLSFLSNNIIASCSKTKLSATTTILTTTATQSSKLRCSEKGCLANPRFNFSDLPHATLTAAQGEAAPPAIGTCIVAAFGLPASEPESGSTASSRALLDDMSLRRNRKRDIFLTELAAWKSQVKDAFGSFLFLERDNSIEPVTVATLTTSTTSHVPQATADLEGDDKTATTATTISSARAALTKATTTTVQQQSALTSFHNRVLKRKHNRKQIEELFVPIGVSPSVHSTRPIVTSPVVFAPSASVSPAPMRESSDPSGAKRDGSGNDLAGHTASLTLDSRQGAGGHGDDDEDKNPHDDDVDGDNVDDEDRESDVEDEETWNEGYRYWKQLRRQWTSPSGEDASATAQVKAHAVHQIPPDLYPRIYHLLVNEGRRLREPVNLSDATKILVAGWRSTGQWPPQPGPPDPLIATRKKLA
ncbi:uncharacterized protein V1513DRAFT_444311 [Lipomyces chichibuensis]|uniref:uncharacterized protein n=1 Tax=Lipomyces chichibuensis TaxID=1546026 RepID=UPI0033440741